MAKRKQKSELTRITEYMISGGAYFWSGYATFGFMDKIIGANFFWAKSVSTLAGWTVNYILQRYWVFKNPKLANHQTEVTSRYVIITLVDFVLDFLIVYYLKRIGITPYIGQFVSAAFFTVWNYFWYKFWVFPDKFNKMPKKRQTLPRVVAHRAHGHSAYRGKA
jgi:putative flippase GtrA